MKYREIAPSRKAGRIIKCYWTLENESDSDYKIEPIIPDGSPEIVFNLNIPFQRLYCGKFEHQPRSIVVGQMKGPVTILPNGRINLFGIRFWPFGLYPVLSDRADQMTGRIESAATVFGNRGERLEARVNLAENTEERIRVFEAEIEDELSGENSVSFETASALRLIEANPAEIRISRLADLIGVGIKRLERRFAREIGITPKYFSRIVRINKLVGNLADLCEMKWTDIGYSYGFSDQSHFIKEFKAFTGISPKAFAVQHKQMSNFFTG